MLRRREGWRQKIRGEVYREIGSKREDFGTPQESHG